MDEFRASESDFSDLNDSESVDTNNSSSLSNQTDSRDEEAPFDIRPYQFEPYRAGKDVDEDVEEEENGLSDDGRVDDEPENRLLVNNW